MNIRRMNFFEDKTTPLNYQSILIVTYGQSDSTLLQGLLNSIDGVVIRGENMNMCFHLFKTYQAILDSKAQYGKLVQSPFYGSNALDEAYFLNQTKETVKNLLLGDRKNDPAVKCYGFKEIRYSENLKDLPEYLKFLKKIFPNPCFIFNTRNNEDVVNSWIKLGWQPASDKDIALEKLKEIEDSFMNEMKVNNTNSFHVSYEDVVNKTEKVQGLYSFLGVPYVKEKVDSVLTIRHSYKSNPTIDNRIVYNKDDKSEVDNRSHKNMLIEKYNCIYFALPKSACSSMKAHVVEELNMKKEPNYPKGIHNRKLYPYPFVEMEKLNSNYQDYLRFCIVRNPWDRLVSCYKDKIRAVGFNTLKYKNGVAQPLLENSPLFYGGMPFDEFVDVVCNIPDSIAEHHFSSQLYQMTDDSGNLLVNYIGKLETLIEDLNVISQKSGFPFSQFPHHHKTEKTAYQDYYTDDLIEKVRKRYAADIAFFNYEFENNNLTKIGFVTDELKEKMSISNWMIDMLKQKNLFSQIANKKIISTRNKRIDVLNNNLKVQKRIVKGMQNSISWKITDPLRALAKFLGFAPNE